VSWRRAAPPTATGNQCKPALNPSPCMRHGGKGRLPPSKALTFLVATVFLGLGAAAFLGLGAAAFLGLAAGCGGGGGHGD
jgi:hypothetical protein